MTDKLHSIAQQDTPTAVDVPPNWAGLVTWAIGRFGSGIVIAAACAFALMRVYDDREKQTERLMVILEQRAKVDSEMTSALLQLRSALDDVSKEARNAHIRQFTNNK